MLALALSKVFLVIQSHLHLEQFCREWGWYHCPRSCMMPQVFLNSLHINKYSDFPSSSTKKKLEPYEYFITLRQTIAIRFLDNCIKCPFCFMTAKRKSAVDIFCFISNKIQWYGNFNRFHFITLFPSLIRNCWFFSPILASSLSNFH